jgi:hypothetical protein
MALRETLQQYRGPATGGAIAFLVICAVVITFEFKGLKGQSNLYGAGQVFYSDDDGKTWFLDDVAKESPFDHDGKQAYRAMVYRCPGGTPFVAFLAKYSDRQKAKVNAEGGIAGNFGDLKKPGDSKWMANSALKSETGYPPVPCPAGGGNAVRVSPTDPDSGATN